MSKTIQPHSDLGQMSDRALEDYIQLHQLDSAEIHTAQKEFSRRRMDRILCLPAQDFLRACERIEQFVSNHKGLNEGDELLRDILSHCAEHYQHDTDWYRAA